MTPSELLHSPRPLAPEKFSDPNITAKGETRASVGFGGLATLWVNTGTLCNITCVNCYIESSPRNDRLAYLSAAELSERLDEAATLGAPLREVGFTGGEPFLNRDLPAMVRDVLSRGLQAMVLTNAMKPMRNHAAAILALAAEYGAALTLRVSLDHHEAGPHDAERGAGSFAQAVDGLVWLARNGVDTHVAGRAGFGDAGEATMRSGYRRLFEQHDIPIDVDDPIALTLFPEMDATADVPEITTACWRILGKSPNSMMCASSRMLVKRRGADKPAYVACTLLPYDPQFELGATLAEASRPVALNHRHCATFCVLGGAACSR
ncbi:MAG: radical superfamily protein [Rhodospirillales bacterium]|nr:radical superfamily protein [Rhodospirillales bacterium]